MNKKLKKIGVFALIFIGISCDNEIEINQIHKPVPFVYCILNQDDSVHYVRISRSFKTDRNIAEIENLEDSIYFDSAVVHLYRMDANQIVETIPFEADYSVAKDSGYFPQNKHIVYSSDEKLNSNTNYKLHIYLPELDADITAETYTLNDIRLLEEFYSPLFKFNFGLTTAEEIGWYLNTNTRAYDLFFRFHYREIHLSDTVHKMLTLPIASVSNQHSRDGKTITWPLPPSLFYNYMLSNLEKNADLRRIADSIDIGFHTYGNAFHSFIEISWMMGNHGITLSDYDFDNIENGIGVFSSRNTNIITGFKLNHRSLDSLSCGQFTRDLNFADHEGVFYCIYHE